MVILYKVKDGPRGETTDEGTIISGDALLSKLKNHVCRYLGEQPPQFNVESPSPYYSHIVFHVSEPSLFRGKFSQKGYYVVENLHPSEAGFLYE